MILLLNQKQLLVRKIKEDKEDIVEKNKKCDKITLRLVELISCVLSTSQRSTANVDLTYMGDRGDLFSVTDHDE